jgi:drug/metabolite transporter (DMT)-like permease
MNPRDLTFFVTLGALWGGSFLLTRVSAPDFGPIPLVGVRIGVAAILMVSILAIRRELAGLRGRLLSLAFVGALNSAIPFCLFAYATLSLPAGFTSVLNASTPVAGAVLGALVLGERLGRRRAIGLGAGFVGVLILVADRISKPGNAAAIGAGLLASFCYAIAGHYTRERLKDLKPMTIAAGSMLGSALLLLIPTLALWPSAPPSGRAWTNAIILGIACTGIAYALYFALIASLGAVRAMAVTYVIPVFGVLWGALLLHEAVPASTVVGGAVILAGTMILNSRSQTGSKAPAPEGESPRPLTGVSPRAALSPTATNG